MLLAAPLAAEAQQVRGVPRIGVLLPSESSSFLTSPSSLREGLRELGYVEGQTILIEWRLAEGHNERLPELARELVARKVDVLVTSGALPTILAAKNATSTIPIVFAGASDPVGTGLVESLSHPGANVTGVSGQLVESEAKRLELLKGLGPRVSRVAYLWRPGPPSQGQSLMQLMVEEAESAARHLGLQLLPIETPLPINFDDAFARMRKARANALLVTPAQFYGDARERLAELALRDRMPTMFGNRLHVEVGGLMSYGVNYVDIYRRTATYVDKILKGAKPADLPVEQPTKFELVVNLKTAKALGLTIPPSLLGRADQVIE